LVLHGDADQVIPVDAGRELAAEAKELGASVDLVIYPGESHGFGADFAKKNATDALNRSTAFLRKELQVK
jgi:dipeptidyl aminopeptidase/acylaminoacyl peptidase